MEVENTKIVDGPWTISKRMYEMKIVLCNGDMVLACSGSTNTLL